MMKRKVQKTIAVPQLLKRKSSHSLNKLLVQQAPTKRSFMLCGLEFDLGQQASGDSASQPEQQQSTIPAASKMPEVLHIPICLVLISRSPMYGFFKRILTLLYEQVMLSDEGSNVIKAAVQQRNETDVIDEGQLIRAIPTLHKCLMQLVHEVPFPPPGKIQVAFKFCDSDLVLSVPNVDDFPVTEVIQYNY